MSNSSPRSSPVYKILQFASGLRFPTLFLLLLALFALDVIIPDVIPFVDEILLGLLTLLLGTWRKRKSLKSDARSKETPSDQS
jgi:hypothetical protein